MRMLRVIPLVVTFGAFLATSSMGLAAETVEIVSSAGASTTWNVRGIGGRPVTVDVPSHTLADITVSKAATPGQDKATDTVEATVCPWIRRRTESRRGRRQVRCSCWKSPQRPCNTSALVPRCFSKCRVSRNPRAAQRQYPVSLVGGSLQYAVYLSF